MDPRTDTHDWDFRFAATHARQTGQNRFIFRDVDGNEFMCREIVSGIGGDSPCAYVLGEGLPNHLTIRCHLVIQNETAYLYPPSPAEF